MKNWLANLLSPRREAAAQDQKSPVDLKPVTDSPSGRLHGWQEEALSLQSEKEVQSLRIELQERDATIEKLRQEIERLRSRQDELLTELLQNHLGALFSDLSAPASQILTQAFLQEEEQKPVQARDVLFVARRMIRTLEQHGLVFEEKVGEQVTFDPNRHTPIGGGNHPQAGQPVTVRFTGTSYAGKIISKAGVE